MDFTNSNIPTRAIVSPYIGYVLKCKDDCYYIGITANFNARMYDHFYNKSGSKWTVLHEPVSIHHWEFILDQDYNEWETTKTDEYINYYGFDKVRGARYCKLEYKKLPFRYRGDGISITVSDLEENTPEKQKPNDKNELIG